MLPLEEYERMRERPSGAPVMMQKWRDLAFLHFSVEPELVQASLPEGLTVDTYKAANGEERAWIGFIPFWMKGVRPIFTPPIPGLSRFPETNVRTYVHQDGREPGVWFYSLDAANKLACATARAALGLPYKWAKMRVHVGPNDVAYWSDRIDSPEAWAGVHVQAMPDGPAQATPGSLDFFLIERYLLYSRLDGNLITARVHHRPYGLRSMEICACEQTLTGVAGFPQQEWEHQAFSPGVDVAIFPPSR